MGREVRTTHYIQVQKQSHLHPGMIGRGLQLCLPCCQFRWDANLFLIGFLFQFQQTLGSNQLLLVHNNNISSSSIVNTTTTASTTLLLLLLLFVQVCQILHGLGNPLSHPGIGRFIMCNRCQCRQLFPPCHGRHVGLWHEDLSIVV